MSVCVNPGDGSCWVAGWLIGGVAKLGADGTELWTGGSFAVPSSVSVNLTDGSCWVGCLGGWTGPAAIVHLSATGTELLRVTQVNEIRGVSVDAGDGTCWATDTGGIDGQVLHYGADGVLLGYTNRVEGPVPVSVDTGDGSCWVGDYYGGQVMHLMMATQVFPDVPLSWWAFDEVAACVDAGVVSGYDDGLYRPTANVTRDQMAVYVSRAVAGGDADVPPGPSSPSFSDVPTTHWAYRHVEFAVDQGIVQGYAGGDYQPGSTVTRDQMAVYIARSMFAPDGEAGLDAAYDPPDGWTFADVPTTHWAFQHVEYCYSQEIVQGYYDGLYHPGLPVTRDQMAVYVARAFELAI
jgi:hypothetical protein